MNKTAPNVYCTLRRDGMRQATVETTQTRAELYDFLGCRQYEPKLEALFARGWA